MTASTYRPNSEEAWYSMCLAALTAMLRARGLMFSTLARTGLEPVGLEIEARAFDLLLANFKELQPDKVVSAVSLT
jgi:hypothetical protein